MPIDRSVLQTFQNQFGQGGTSTAEISSYYNYLESNGVPYGGLALDVALQQGLFGQLADGYFDHKIQEIHQD